MSEAPVAVGEVIANKYCVERVIGVGGMGVVVEARHLELGHLVALKFLAPKSPIPDAVARFHKEARALAKIRSDYVTRILDVGELDDGTPYMVMELLDGHDLSAELKRRGQLPEDEAIAYMQQALEAISEAHAVGIVHRDLKPSNLFLVRRNDGSVVIKVLDFGVAKTIEQDSYDLALTRAAMMVGSPCYMAPEQMVSAATVDERADIWSLGVIFYRMLTGALPFRAESFVELRALLQSDAPVSFSQVRSQVSAPLANIVLRCLAKDPAERYASVRELALDLSRLRGFRQEPRDSATRALAYAPPSASAAAWSSAVRSEPMPNEVAPVSRPRRWLIAGLTLCFAFGAVALLSRTTSGAGRNKWQYSEQVSAQVVDPAKRSEPAPAQPNSASNVGTRALASAAAPSARPHLKRPTKNVQHKRSNRRHGSKTTVPISDFGGRR